MGKKQNYLRSRTLCAQTDKETGSIRIMGEAARWNRDIPSMQASVEEKE